MHINDLFVSVVTHEHGYRPPLGEYFIKTETAYPTPAPLNCRVGHVGGGKFEWMYGLATKQLRDAVLPYMSEGVIGSFHILKWKDPERWVMWAKPMNMIGHQFVCNEIIFPTDEELDELVNQKLEGNGIEVPRG